MIPNPEPALDCKYSLKRLVLLMQSFVDEKSKLIGQIESWRNRLLDIGNRNPLISASLSPTRGAMELAHPAPEEIWRKLVIGGEAGSRAMRFPWKRELIPPTGPSKSDDEGQLDFDFEPEADGEKKDWNPSIEECLESSRFKADDLLTTIGDRTLDRRLRNLDGYARLSISEQGLHCLYLAFGFIKWFESIDSTKEIRSPLLLVPAAFRRETADSPWNLVKAEDDIIDNLCLRQRFKQDFGLELPAFPDLEQLEEEGARAAYLDEIKHAIRENKRWEIEDRCCLGRFAFPKIAMWQDLGENIGSISTSAICQSIGGQGSDASSMAFGDPSIVPDASQLDDKLPPGEIKAILDCDSSQLEAIVAARNGISFVLDGPPGTGKSQTIANIIADALSVGKRVLFVSEKVAALDVVKRRLDDCGLGDFCLECHSSKANRKAVLEELKGCLELPSETYLNTTPKLNELREQRQALNDYVRILHQPQQPIGMSMYELHGQIARLTRLGMIGRSRVMIPAPESLSRSELSSRFELLRLAKQHEGVLLNYEKHPWRECRMTSQTLGLKSEIRDHFTTLATCVENVVYVLKPLEEAGLIADDTTPLQLRPLVTKLETSLAAPSIPEGWFVSPGLIARTLLDRHKAHLEAASRRRELSEYVDEVAELFSEDVVELSDLGNNHWVKSIKDPLPSTLEACYEKFRDFAATLRALESSLQTLDLNLKELIGELKLPIKGDPPISSLGKLISAARIVATESIFQPSWFDPERANLIIASAKDALARLDALQKRRENLQGGPEPEILAKLAKEIGSVEVLRRSWGLVKSRLPNSQTSDLNEYMEKLQSEQNRLERINKEVSHLASELCLGDAFNPTIDEVRSIADGLPLLLEVGAYNGKWAYPAIRGTTKQRIESALLDLTEAQELRNELENKFSHRAFLPAARQLVNRGKRFSSWWTRLVGGYAKYRTEVADLYKTAVPDTKTLLTDLLQLGSFHRRKGEVDSVYQEIKDDLLDGFAVDGMESWKTNLNALTAFETFVSKASHTVQAMPKRSVSFTMRPDDPCFDRLSELLTSSQSKQAADMDLLLGIGRLPIREALSTVTDLLSAIQICTKAVENAQLIYETRPAIEQLLSDLESGHAYLEDSTVLTTLFSAHAGDLPKSTNPFEATGWNAALRGIESAERLAKIFGNSPALREVVCLPGNIDREKLAAISVAAEQALQESIRLWTEEATFVELVQPGQQEVEARKRIVTELKQSVVDFATEFERISHRFSLLLPILRPGVAPPLSRLPQDAKNVQTLRDAQKTLASCNATLGQHNLVHSEELSNGDIQVCEWILKTSESELQSPLVKAIATSSATRTQVSETLSSLKTAVEQMSEPGKFFGTLFNPTQSVSWGFVPKDLLLRELPTTLRQLLEQIDSIDDWIRFNRWREQMKDAGLGIVVDELIQAMYSPAEAEDAVCAKLYQQLFDHFTITLPQICDFDGVRHEQIREKYRQLDEWEIKAAAARVREYQLGREDRPRIGWLAPITSELGILKRETEKKRRHMPLRKLFNAVPGVLQRLKPCIMMSPLSVSTFLQSDALKFDLVIFDEASQVFPWDAIGAIYRGTQLIVAGDDKQLPPTSFFTRADIESEDEEDDIGDFESILSLCKSVNMPNKRLRWHYRSRREPLIAFSNKHFYEGDLVTFPSVRDAAQDAVQLVHVADGLWSDRKNLPEARRVAELVVEHYRKHPNKSLGVIAFNTTQQHAIEDAIYDLRRSSPVIDVLLKEGTHEPLFIKNLENVQGDERDVILLSFGYGKNEAGKFIKNFGPLSKPGGERRLNVAVTRAREGVALVASVRASDMDLSGSTSMGAHLIKAYLEYAEHGVESISRSIVETQGFCESPFEEEVAAALIRNGLEPVPQVGCGGFRIDLALKHPAHPGLYCLGIECDGATYHSSKTARDRDRIRQSILEGLGWRICRIWSTDWIRNPDLQIKRILAEYERVSLMPPEMASISVSEPEVEFDDLQPQYRSEDDTKTPTYSKIEDVPTQHIIDSTLRIVTRVGTIDWSELVSLSARELGFARTGRKIRDRIEATLDDLVRQSSLNRSDDRISLP